jgi:hypothetical protein
MILVTSVFRDVKSSESYVMSGLGFEPAHPDTEPGPPYWKGQQIV